MATVTRTWSAVGAGTLPISRILGSSCFSLCLRVQDEIAVDAEHVFKVVNGLKVLAIPVLLVARVQQILRVGSPLGQNLPHLLVIRCGFLQHLEPVESHDIQRNRIRSRRFGQESQHLLARVHQVAINKVAGIDQEDQRISVSRLRFNDGC